FYERIAGPIYALKWLFRFNFKLSGQANVFRSRADHHLESSWLDHEMHLPIPEREIVARQAECHSLRFARLEMNTFDPAKVLFIASHTGEEFTGVELNDLVAFARARVGDIARDDNVDALRIGHLTRAARVGASVGRATAPTW